MTISTNNGVPAKVAKIEMRAHTDNQMYKSFDRSGCFEWSQNLHSSFRKTPAVEYIPRLSK